MLHCLVYHVKMVKIQIDLLFLVKMTVIWFTCRCFYNLANVIFHLTHSLRTSTSGWNTYSNSVSICLSCIPGPRGFLKSCSFYVNLPLTRCHIYDYQLLGCAQLSISLQPEWHFAVTGRLIMEYMHAAPVDCWAGEVGICPHVKQWDWRSEDTVPQPMCICQTSLLEQGSSDTSDLPVCARCLKGASLAGLRSVLASDRPGWAAVSLWQALICCRL